MSAIASNLMTGEPNNPVADRGASKELIEDAIALSVFGPMRDPQIRAQAVEAAHALALLFLLQAVNLKKRTVDDVRIAMAQRCIDVAIEHGEEKAPYLGTACQINMSWGRYDVAYDFASKAVESQPRNPEAVRMMGMAAYATGRLTEAKALLQEALVLFPGLDGVREPLELLKKELS